MFTLQEELFLIVLVSLIFSFLFFINLLKLYSFSGKLLVLKYLQYRLISFIVEFILFSKSSHFLPHLFLLFNILMSEVIVLDLLSLHVH